MTIDQVATVIPVEDLPSAVETWTAVLGAAPTFVDGDRWAQFDVAGGRVALAGTDRMTEGTAVLLRVRDLDQERENALARGLTVGEIVDGPHERRCAGQTNDGVEFILYCRK